MSKRRESAKPGRRAAGLTAVVLGGVLAVLYFGLDQEFLARESGRETSSGVDRGLDRERPAPSSAADASLKQVALAEDSTFETKELETADDLRAAATRYLATDPADRAQLEIDLQRALARLEEIRPERNRLVDETFDLLTERDTLRESDPEAAAELWRRAEETRSKLIPLCMEGAKFGALLFDYGAEPALRDVVGAFRDGADQRPELKGAVERFLRGELTGDKLTAMINPAYVRFKAGPDAFNEVGECSFRLGDALLGMWGTEHMARANPEAAEAYLAEALEYFPDAAEPAQAYHLALIDLAKKGQVEAVEKALKFQEKHSAKRGATPMPTTDYNEACFWFVVMQSKIATPSVKTVDRGIGLLHQALDDADVEYRLHLVEAIYEDADLAGLRELMEEGHGSALALKARLDAIQNGARKPPIPP